MPHVNRHIAPLRVLAHRHCAELDCEPSDRALDCEPSDRAADRLSEFNVLEQVRLLRDTTIIRDSVPAPLVHGWIFSLTDGRIEEFDSGYSAGSTHQDTPHKNAG
ncbi:carbonic anhydrase [Paraburkholderia sp. HC6.4b]|nr:carbonic anhydrase [Paraburkholderia sp. HC6.4b]MBB5454333.1 carbonic anhydrase [Paraburkholderia sp. Kb1A]